MLASVACGGAPPAPAPGFDPNIRGSAFIEPATDSGAKPSAVDGAPDSAFGTAPALAAGAPPAETVPLAEKAAKVAAAEVAPAPAPPSSPASPPSPILPAKAETPRKSEENLPKLARVTFGLLSGFTYALEPGKPTDEEVRARLPAAVAALHGRVIDVEGFMLPMDVAPSGRVTSFFLLPNQLMCCYGVPPEVNEWVEVKTRGDGVPALTDIPILVRGRFEIGERSIDDVMVGLYRMTADSVREK